MFQRKSLRLATFNYAKPGAYFVTICTKDNKNIFGKIRNGVVELSEEGLIAYRCWQEITSHFGNVSIDEFVIMPNHVHGIIEILDVGARFIAPRKSNGSNYGGFAGRGNPMGSGSLGEIVRWFKGRITYECQKGAINRAPTDIINTAAIWQRNYHDHIVRDDEDLNRIRQYIRENPAKWNNDVFQQ